jgi:hypothetical protein
MTARSLSYLVSIRKLRMETKYDRLLMPFFSSSVEFLP